MTGRELAKALALSCATLAVSPLLLSYAIRASLLGRDRAIEGSSQLLAIVPGIVGQYVRRAFLRHTLAYCDRTATVEFGTLFSRAGARLERNAYVGPRCHLGLVHLEQDVLVGAGVHIPSGGDTHGTLNTQMPIREQPGQPRLVRIGRGAWIGSAAVILADVGRETVVGAGAVVTRPLPERVVAVGVPARVVRSRDIQEPASPSPRAAHQQ
jgi:acetyltransferase-like isoleucine patch superfamily enzyme